MTVKQRFEEYERRAKVLESVASRYGERSQEYAVIQEAAIALLFVLTHDYDRFLEYRNRFEGELTPEQRAHLERLGIDPDADPVDRTSE